MVISGLIILKKAYGAYDQVSTPKTRDCVAPQVFHGIKTEVIVPLSSRVRLKTSGLSPFSLYVFVNIRPGTTMAMYWSDAVVLKNMQVPTVDATRLPVLFAYFTMGCVMRFSKPAIPLLRQKPLPK